MILVLCLLALAGCVVIPPPRPMVMMMPIPSMLVAPGPGKDKASFDQDDALCRRATPNHPIGDNIYAQCMISKGNIIQSTPYY